MIQIPCKTRVTKNEILHKQVFIKEIHKKFQTKNLKKMKKLTKKSQK